MPARAVIGANASTTLYTGWRSIFDNFFPLTTIAGYLDAMAILMICVFVIIAES